MPHHGQIVGDEQVGEAEFLLQLGEQVQDLGLDRDVEGRDGLVEHQELRIEGQCPGHADALALSTRELVRVPLGHSRVHPHQTQEIGDGARSLGRRHVGVDVHELADGGPHRHPRIERGEGILKHDLHLPAQLAQLPAIGGDDVDAFSPSVVHHPE